MQDKAGQYTQALQNLKLFLLTSPPAADAEAAKTLIDEIEYRQEKAAKERTVAEIKTNVEEKKKGLRDLVGNWYMKEPFDHAKYPYANYAHYRGEMRGEELFFIYVIDVPYWDWRKGEERVFFIANRLEANKLIGRFPGVTEQGTYEITVSHDFNNWEFYYKNQYTNDRQTYTRR